MPLDCPTCESQNTQKLSIVFASGTNLSSKVMGGVVVSGGHIGFASGTSKGRSQTALALQYAPPSKPALSGLKGIAIWFFLIFFGSQIFGFLMGAIFQSYGVGALALLAGVIGGIAIALRMSKKVGELYQEQYQHWERKHLCLRCGTTFVPKVGLPAINAVSVRASA